MNVNPLNYNSPELSDSNKYLNALTDECRINQPFRIDDDMVFDSAIGTMQMSVSYSN